MELARDTHRWTRRRSPNVDCHGSRGSGSNRLANPRAVSLHQRLQGNCAVESAHSIQSAAANLKLGCHNQPCDMLTLGGVPWLTTVQIAKRNGSQQFRWTGHLADMIYMFVSSLKTRWRPSSHLINGRWGLFHPRCADTSNPEASEPI